MADRFSQEELAESIVRAKQGSLKAFEQVLFCYEKQVYGFMFRFVQSRVDAEDLTQETFLKVYTSLGSFDTEKPFAPWLFTIATHTAYDWLRKLQRRGELFIIDDENHPFETIDERQTYSAIEARLDVEAALAKLKPTHRFVLLLYYGQQLSYEQIAEMLPAPIGTVKTHLYRARKALEDIGKKEYYEQQ